MLKLLIIWWEVSLLKSELLSLMSKDILTILRDHIGWLLTGDRKQ